MLALSLSPLVLGFGRFVSAAARETASVYPVSCLSSASIGVHLRLSLFFASFVARPTKLGYASWVGY
jgi:hypothetical protein